MKKAILLSVLFITQPLQAQWECIAFKDLTKDKDPQYIQIKLEESKLGYQAMFENHAITASLDPYTKGNPLILMIHEAPPKDVSFDPSTMRFPTLKKPITSTMSAGASFGTSQKLIMTGFGPGQAYSLGISCIDRSIHFDESTLEYQLFAELKTVSGLTPQQVNL